MNLLFSFLKCICCSDNNTDDLLETKTSVAPTTNNQHFPEFHDVPLSPGPAPHMTIQGGEVLPHYQAIDSVGI